LFDTGEQRPLAVVDGRGQGRGEPAESRRVGQRHDYGDCQPDAQDEERRLSYRPVVDVPECAEDGQNLRDVHDGHCREHADHGRLAGARSRVPKPDEPRNCCVKELERDQVHCIESGVQPRSEHDARGQVNREGQEPCPVQADALHRIRDIAEQQRPGERYEKVEQQPARRREVARVESQQHQLRGGYGEYRHPEREAGNTERTLVPGVRADATREQRRQQRNGESQRHNHGHSPSGNP